MRLVLSSTSSLWTFLHVYILSFPSEVGLLLKVTYKAQSHVILFSYKSITILISVHPTFAMYSYVRSNTSPRSGLSGSMVERGHL
jgi:hypothetical protein